MNKRPNSKVNLDRAIQRLYGSQAKYVEIRSVIANTIVGQFLPEGVVKGGSAAFIFQILDHFQYLSDTPAAVDANVIGSPVICQNPPSCRSADTVT